jgi:hypothetical protein
MVKESKHHLGNLPGDLYDLDIAPSGQWIGVTEFGESQSLSFAGKTVALPEQIRFPKVAAIDDETALVVNSRAYQDKNAWIITSAGEIKANFFAGDAIQSILASERFLVVTYFDESALTSLGIEGNGVTVFDLDGNFGFGYKEVFGEEAVDIADCYCACWAEENRMLFFPYTDFPLVSFDLESKTQEVWETPGEVVGSNGLTMIGRTVYFHSPYNDEQGIYEWQIGDDVAALIGKHAGSLADANAGHLRGLRRGRFLAVEKTGYTILSPSEI